MPRDAVAADGPKEAAADQSGSRAPGLASCEGIGQLRGAVEELGKGIAFEMMQKQIGKHHVGATGRGPSQKIEDVRRNRFGLPTKIVKGAACALGHDVLTIHQSHLHIAPTRRQSLRQRQHEGAVARAEFDKSAWCPPVKGGDNEPCHDARLQHPAIDAFEVPTRPYGPRIGLWQFVQPFRVDAAGKAHDGLTDSSTLVTDLREIASSRQSGPARTTWRIQAPRFWASAAWSRERTSPWPMTCFRIAAGSRATRQARMA